MKNLMKDIFDSLPEEEKNKIYLEIEKSMRTREVMDMLDPMRLIVLEGIIHKEFDSIDFKNLKWHEVVSLRREFEEILRIIRRIKEEASHESIK